MTVLRRKAAVALAWMRLQLGHAVAGLAVFLLEKKHTPKLLLIWQPGKDKAAGWASASR